MNKICMVQHVHECDPDTIKLFSTREQAVGYLLNDCGYLVDEDYGCCNRLEEITSKLSNKELLTDEEFRLVEDSVFENHNVLLEIKEVK